MRTETIRYRIVAREVLVDNLSQEDAFTIMGNYEAQGKLTLLWKSIIPKQNDLVVIQTYINPYK